MRKRFRFPISDKDFRTSSWSKNNPKTCVAVAVKPEGVAVRNSNDSSKTTAFFTRTEWDIFIKGVKNNEFDA